VGSSRSLSRHTSGNVNTDRAEVKKIGSGGCREERFSTRQSLSSLSADSKDPNQLPTFVWTVFSLVIFIQSQAEASPNRRVAMSECVAVGEILCRRKISAIVLSSTCVPPFGSNRRPNCARDIVVHCILIKLTFCWLQRVGVVRETAYALFRCRLPPPDGAHSCTTNAETQSHFLVEMVRVYRGRGREVQYRAHDGSYH
jgi:hypothetical protein